MHKNRTSTLQDTEVDVKVVLCGLWTATLFVFADVDIFGFWRADVINGATVGEVSGTGFGIDQTFLVLTTVYVLVPSLMVVVSLVAPARVNRAANVTVSLSYAASVVLSVLGETWAHFILGSAVELVLLLAVARTAWAWPGHPADRAPARAGRASRRAGARREGPAR